MSAHPPQPTPSAPRPAPSLISLPTEILSAIALHLCQADALALTYASRNFAEVTERALWRTLDLSLTPWYGRLPSTYDYDPTHDSNAYIEATSAELEAADDLWADRLREKLKAMTMAGDARRWSMTECVRIVDRPGEVQWLPLVLDCIAPSLRSLEFADPPSLFSSRFYEAKYPEERHKQQLQYALITHRWRIHFPSLTHVHLARYSVRCCEFIILLCNCAPKLVSLSAYFARDRPYYDDDDEASSEHALKCERDTTIQYLQMSGDMWGSDCMLQLLTSSPHLQDISLSGTCWSWEQVLRVLLERDGLRKLHIDGMPAEYYFYTNGMSVSGPGPRTLVLRCGYWHELYEVPFLTNLETLCFTHYGIADHAVLPSHSFPTAVNDVQSFPYPLAEGLLGSPRLHTIHSVNTAACVNEPGSNILDFIDEDLRRNGTVIGVIRSLRHEQGELLHARLVYTVREVADVDESEVTDSNPLLQDPRLCFTYISDDSESYRHKIFEEAPLVWQNFTDYNGKMVPPAIILEMLEVEGMREADWEGRGVEVGEAAWKVLTDWEKGCLKRSEWEL